MNAHILMVDDQIGLLGPIGQLLGQEGYRVTLAGDGDQALRKAAEDRPDLVIVDVEMPGMDGYEVVRRLRSLRSTALTPILILSAHSGAPAKVQGLKVGADDFVTKPVDWEEFKARIDAVLRRARRGAGANPLTGLPGNSAIEIEVTRRIRDRRRFALAHVDIDFFKSYNDAYGFAKGDAVLKALGQVLLDAAEKAGFAEDFVGHVGGDDFVLVTSPESLDAVVARAMELFDWLVPGFYAEADRQRGGVDALSRRGQPEFYPMIRLSIGATSTEKRAFESYGQAAGVASEMKAFAKTLKRAASFVAKDRREA